jgi:hypothetical protein
MASQVTAGGANGTVGARGPRAAPKKQVGATKTNEVAVEPPAAATGMADSDWTSEKRLVSALAMLQDMEGKVCIPSTAIYRPTAASLGVLRGVFPDSSASHPRPRPLAGAVATRHDPR